MLVGFWCWELASYPLGAGGDFNSRYGPTIWCIPLRQSSCCWSLPLLSWDAAPIRSRQVIKLVVVVMVMVLSKHTTGGCVGGSGFTSTFFHQAHSTNLAACFLNIKVSTCVASIDMTFPQGLNKFPWNISSELNPEIRLIWILYWLWLGIIDPKIEGWSSGYDQTLRSFWFPNFEP